MFKTPRTFQIALLFYYVGPLAVVALSVQCLTRTSPVHLTFAAMRQILLGQIRNATNLHSAYILIRCLNFFFCFLTPLF